MPKPSHQSKVGEAVLEYLAAVAERLPEARVTAIEQNQITLPVAVVRRLDLHRGRRLTVRLEDDRIVLRPEPEDWVWYSEEHEGRLREDVPRDGRLRTAGASKLATLDGQHRSLDGCHDVDA